MGGGYDRLSDKATWTAWILVILSFLLVIILSVCIPIFDILPLPYLWITIKIWLACMFFFVPSYLLNIFSEKLKLTGLQESTLHWAGLMIFFGLYTFIFKLPVKWIVIVAVFYSFNHFGGFLIKYLNKKIILRYYKDPKLKLNYLWDREFETFLLGQQVVYCSIPLSFFSGLTVGLYLHYSEAQIFTLSVKILLALVILLQGRILYLSFKYLTNPLIYKEKKHVYTNLDNWITVEKSVLQSRYYDKLDEINEEESNLDIAIAITELRKLLFYNSTLNAISFSSMIMMGFLITGFSLSIQLTIGIFLGLILLLSELPYGLGQYKMHDALIEEVQGVQREDLKEKLTKYAGLVPKLPFIVSLTSGFTAGGILFYAIETFIKDGITK